MTDGAADTLDDAKKNGRGVLRYKLRDANVFKSSEGILYIDYLDPVDEIDPEISGRDVNPEAFLYIESMLQSNAERFRSQLDVVASLRDVAGSKILDIGCGGGQFLALAKKAGADTIGIELEDTRAFYATTKEGLTIVKRPVGDAYWRSYYGNFDIVTLWDVIEHVNFPVETLQQALKLLKPGGHLIIDTPCKDSFYHRFGQFTYTISMGKFPTFLNIMYSSNLFGHKQIFSTKELCSILKNAGLSVVRVEKFHELSFPLSFYIKKLTKSAALTKLLTPAAKFFFRIAKIRNKMLLVAERAQ